MNSSTSSIKTLCEEFFNSSNSDEQLIKVLTKILSILKLSEKFQKDLFIHLSDKGINKLLSSLKNNNEEIRKLSSKMILEMLYNNEVLQNIFCEKFNFNPVGNVICFNWLPKYLKENIRLDERVITEIKNSQNITGSQLKYWIWPANTKYTDEVMPDPQKYLIGFYSATKNSFIFSVENKASEERLDTKILTTKLEGDSLMEDDKPGIVAAGSGSESSSKIKEKYLATEPISFETSILRKQDNNNTKGNNNKPETATINNNHTPQIHSNDKHKSSNEVTKASETKVVKDEYKKKEKNYSRSIDSNIASKVKNMNTNLPNLIPHTNNTLGTTMNNIHINDAAINKIRINKAKK